MEYVVGALVNLILLIINYKLTKMFMTWLNKKRIQNEFNAKMMRL